MSDFSNSALLVTGASGHFGRLAIDELLARGATNVIAGTRNPSNLADLAARGVSVRALDFDNPATLAPAFAGVERVLLISTDALGRRVPQHRAAISAATAAGVNHIVYTSAPTPRPNVGTGVSPEHYWTEIALAASGIDFTALRNHIYAEITLLGVASVVASGKLYDATNGRARAYLSRADAARTAAGALLTATGPSIHDVTGPCAVTQTELAEILSATHNAPITRIGLTAVELHAGLVAAGLPSDFADVLVAFDVDAALGFHDIVTDTVKRFSGRTPQSLSEFLATQSHALA